MYESLAPYLSSFFILFREGFEALLIAILVFTYLDKVNARHQRPAVMWGLVAGVVASLILALAVKQIAAVTHAHEEIFEGSVMLIASGMLAYVDGGGGRHEAQGLLRGAHGVEIVVAARSVTQNGDFVPLLTCRNR